jgi:hypothetical protein
MECISTWRRLKRRAEEMDFEHHPVTTRINAAKTNEAEFLNPI